MTKTLLRAFAACCLLAPAWHAAGAAEATHVSVSIMSVTSDAGIFLAIERGYFAEQNLAVDLSRTTSLSEVLPLLATDKLDVGTGGSSPGLFNAFRRGVQARIVTDKSSLLPPGGDETGGLMVRKDLLGGEIKTIADLKGRAIGINNIQTTSLNYITRPLALAGLKRDDVKLVEMPFNQFVPALEKKAVDAVLVFTPLNQTLAKMGLAANLPGAQLGDTSKGDSFNIMLYSPAFAKTDAAKRFMVAHLKGQRDYLRAVQGKADMKAVCRVVNKYVASMPPDCGTLSFTGIDPDGGVNTASLQRYQKEWLELGVMKEPADIGAHVDQSFARNAAAVLGPYQ